MDSEERFNESFVPQDTLVLRRTMGQLGDIVAIRRQGRSTPKSIRPIPFHLLPNTFVFGR